MTARRFSVYGITLATDLPLANRLPDADGPADLEFVESATAVFDPERADELYASPWPLPSGVPHQLVFRADEDTVVRWSEVTDFRIGADRITAVLWDETYRYVLEIHLLGTACALWLERRGRPALHASGIVIGDGAVAFTGPSGAGKTSTATALLRRGHRLLADDIVAVERVDEGWRAHRGHPQMRMWPAEADTFAGGHEHLEIVNPFFDKRRVPVGGEAGVGAFATGPAPLRAVYHLTREPTWPAGRVEVETAPGAEAVMALVRESFMADLIDRLGFAPRRLRTFADLAADVPVRRLRYSAGPAEMDAVAAAVEEDVG